VPKNVSSKASGKGRPSPIWPSWKSSNRAPAADIIHMWRIAAFVADPGLTGRAEICPLLRRVWEPVPVPAAGSQTGILA